jgi:hypothetical protein
MANPTGLGQHVACDHCVDFGLALHCPGVLAHCTSGEHCTTVIEVCAIDAGRDDHGWCCCHCGQSLQAGRS